MKLLFISIFWLVFSDARPGLARETLLGPIPASLVRVVDGDTLAVRALIWPGQHIDIKVRLANIDAPELFRPHCVAEKIRAGKARDFLILRTSDQVMLKAVHLGKYAGRVIARVETDAGEDLSTLLMQAGLAHTMADPSPWCPEDS